MAEGLLHEECGVFGVWSKEERDVAMTTYYGLFSLQHRGQESCGIVVGKDGLFQSYKDTGIVNDVFTPDVLSDLGTGTMAVGHVRYSTTGGNDRMNAQPIVVNHMKGHLALAHNGNLTNTLKLREELELNGAIFHMTSDTEVISYLIIRERLRSHSIEEAISHTMDLLEGAYSLCIMSPKKLIAVRDPHGFRPLCYGITPDGQYVVSSESCALNAVGARLVRDLAPGEIIVVDENGLRSITDHCNSVPCSHCVFEYIYFSRPDSIIDGASVHMARLRAGEFLAKAHPVEADLVIGVPDSGLDAAVGYARASGIHYGIGLIKNKYVARTFIAPNQQMRENKVRIKLNPIAEVVRGKRIVLIDDSIVRGTTSRYIVDLLREAGAAEIHMRISAPPFVNPCYYGTDIDSREHLIACHHTVDEIAAIIGADSLGYLPLEAVTELCGDACKGFCTACFSGTYPVAPPEEDSGKRRFELPISQSHKQSKTPIQ